MKELVLPVVLYIVVFGMLFAAPAIFAMKHAGKLFLLNMVVSGPLFYGIFLLGDYLDLMRRVIGPVSSLIPEVLIPVIEMHASVISWALIPIWPSLVVFLLIRLCAKHYAAEFGLMRLFGTLLCSSTIGLMIYFYVVMVILTLH